MIFLLKNLDFEAAQKLADDLAFCLYLSYDTL